VGFIQVYTGNGKGKTTAAVGAAVRAAGAGMRVFFMQFMKGKAYNEQKILRSLPQIDLYTTGKPFFVAKHGMLTEEERAALGDVVVFAPGEPPQEYVELIRRGFQQAAEAMRGGLYDLVVLDEINMAVFFELLPQEAVIHALQARHAKTEVILTGRCAAPELVALADLVTEMREVKHYYSKGIEARDGIER